MKVKVTPSKVHGNVKIPASKSMAHRALICASLSDGTSIVSNVTNSKDIEATVGCMKALGANIKQIDENNASLDINLNYGGKDEPLSKVILAKENNSWIIVDIKFSNQQETPITPKTLNGNWSNAMVTLHISDDGLAFEYHGQ